VHAVDAGREAVEVLRLGRPGTLAAGVPGRLLAALAFAVLATAALVAVGHAPARVLAVAVLAAGHAALLGTAVAWAAEEGRRGGRRPASCVTPAVLVAGATTASALHPAGAVLHLVTLAWLAWQAREGRLAALGLGAPVPAAGVAAGALVGVFLGAHVLITASLTLGYRPGAHAAAAVLATLAYDAGAQVPATELFFRGGLFNRALRRWSFAPAAVLATAASLARYLVDPRLPWNAEVVVGMAFYVTVLGVLNAWLLWRFGSAVPGLVSALLFFAGYRVVTG
jgi:hypothetical protein